MAVVARDRGHEVATTTERISLLPFSRQISSLTTTFLLFLLFLQPSATFCARKDLNMMISTSSSSSSDAARKQHMESTIKRHEKISTASSSSSGGTSKEFLPVVPPPYPRKKSQQYWSWREGRVFNASAHEVPSGPNPISNR